MVLTKTVDLGDNRLVQVKEMTLGQFRQLLNDLSDFSNLDFSNLSVIDLLGDSCHLMTQKLEPFIEFPEKEGFDSLTWDELKKVYHDFVELNPFFLPLIQALKKYLSVLEQMSPQQLLSQLHNLNTMPSS